MNGNVKINHVTHAVCNLQGNGENACRVLNIVGCNDCYPVADIAVNAVSCTDRRTDVKRFINGINQCALHIKFGLGIVGILKSA